MENQIQISNKKIKINSAVFSEDEDDDEGKEKEEPIAISNESLNTPSVSGISLEDIEKLIQVLEKTRRGVEQMKNESSSPGIIPTICHILDDIMEPGLSSQLSNPSALVFVSLCLRELQLSSSTVASDDQFLRLVESYIDTSLRPNQYISLFLIGVVLQRVRKLQAPASRLLMKAIDVCMTHCLDPFNFFLSRVLTPPAKTNETSEDVFLHSFQYELVQRIVRQNSYTQNHSIDSLLTHMMTPSEILLISNNSSFHLKQTREDYLLLDSLLNYGLSSPLLEADAMTQYLSHCTTNYHHLTTPSFPMTQESMKFLSSFFLSVLLLFLSFSHVS